MSNSVARGPRGPRRAIGPLRMKMPSSRCHSTGCSVVNGRTFDGRPAPVLKPWSDTTMTVVCGPAAATIEPISSSCLT